VAALREATSCVLAIGDHHERWLCSAGERRSHIFLQPLRAGRDHTNPVTASEPNRLDGLLSVRAVIRSPRLCGLRGPAGGTCRQNRLAIVLLHPTDGREGKTGLSCCFIPMAKVIRLR
jgi:hypothetical protein